MNIFDFINSKDIGEHLKRIEYPLNALEASWIVYQNDTHSMAQKMEAWRWIMDNMEDCEVLERINCIYRPSLFKTLEEYIALINGEITRFYETELGFVYLCSYWRGDAEVPEDDEHVFSRPEKWWKYLDDYTYEDAKYKTRSVRITKVRIDSESFNPNLTAYFSEKKELMDIFSYSAEEGNYLDFWGGLWFDFPVPFEKGDILIHYDEHINPYRKVAGGPFVLDDITPWIIERFEDKWKKYYSDKFGDVTDMTVCGYFQNSDGRIFREVTHNYLDYEIYRGPLDGKYRLLKALSSFVKGKIGVDMLLTTYRKVILDEFSDDVMLKSFYSDNWLALSGLKRNVEE